MTNKDEVTKKEDKTPYFFLVGGKYALGTPRGMGSSERTVDIPFHDLAKSYDLQTKLGLLSTCFIKHLVHPIFAQPLYGQELIEGVAYFLAAFAEDPAEQKERSDYLIKNGLVRILANDGSIEEVRELIKAESK